MDQNVIAYIQTNLAQGKSKEEIYKELLSHGTTIEVIQASFNSTTSEQDKADTQKKTIHIIVTIAAILIGAGIFSFVASNWQGMAKPVKIGVILTTMLIAYSLGWYIKEKKNLLKTGEAVILLGVIVYGAGIFLVAQVFNVPGNWPDGFILWMLGTIAMAYASESFPLFYLAIPLGLIAIIGHPISLFTTVTYDSFLLTSSFLLVVTTIITFITAWIVHQKIPEDLKKYL